MAKSITLASRVETITPHTAHELLSTKVHPDRGISEAYVNRLASDMRLGFWTVNGESIKIDTSGEVIDGQHRLTACIAADKPFDTLVVRDLPTDDRVQFTTDNGRRRSLSDALKIMGESYTGELSGSSTMMWRFITANLSVTSGPSVPVGLKLVDRFGGDVDGTGLRASARYVTRLRHHARGFSLSTSFATWAHYTFGEIERRKSGADTTNVEFWEGVILGVELIEDDPRLHLRNRLIIHHDSTKNRTRLGLGEMRALYVKAWNAYSDGRTMSSSALRWRQVGPGREGFPELNDVELLEDWFRIRL